MIQATLLDIFGCKVGGADPKRNLSNALIRNNWKDFVSVGNGYIGLRSFYGNVKSSGSKTASKNKTQAKQSRKTHPVSQTKTTKHVTRDARKRAQPSPIRVAIHEFMQDGELYAADSIVEAMLKKFDHAIKPIAVRGTLSNGKEFEKIGNQYRLVA